MKKFKRGNDMSKVKSDNKATVAKKETVKKKVVEVKNVDELKSIADEKKEVETIRKGTVNIDNLRLRKGPSTDSEILKLLQPGDQVEILEDANKDFYKVKGGFLMKRFIDIYEK